MHLCCQTGRVIISRKKKVWNGTQRDTWSTMSDHVLRLNMRDFYFKKLFFCNMFLYRSFCNLSWLNITSAISCMYVERNERWCIKQPNSTIFHALPVEVNRSEINIKSFVNKCRRPTLLPGPRFYSLMYQKSCNY